MTKRRGSLRSSKGFGLINDQTKAFAISIVSSGHSYICEGKGLEQLPESKYLALGRWQPASSAPGILEESDDPAGLTAAVSTVAS